MKFDVFMAVKIYIVGFPQEFMVHSCLIKKKGKGSRREYDSFIVTNTKIPS
jgi:hypothetical protein